MIELGPIVDRLTACGAPRVLGVLEYSAQQVAPILPAHFVAPLDEDATPNRLSGADDQLVTARFQVIIVVGAAAARSARPSEELGEHVRRVRDALTGWTLPGSSRPVQYAGGRLLSAGGREALWSARFRTAYHLRSQTQ